jgi:hypothetical protein
MSGEDWVNRLFQGGEGARGLSGAGAAAVALTDAGSFYNFRLRRHFTAGNLAAEPRRIWLTHDDPAKASGLAVHMAEAMADGRMFADVLIVLAQDDWDTAFEEDPQYDERVSAALADAYADLRARRGLPPLSRRLGVWLVKEGSPEVDGRDFGLLDGEFVTGLLPNLYRRPGPRSVARVALHLNLPGVWEGYREVGRVYDDQVLFTLGSHFFDNYSHPTLREPALFGLRVDDTGAVQQVLNPDVSDRYRLHTTDQAGIQVITLATLDGEPLAYIVLWSLDDIQVADEVPYLDAGAVSEVGLGGAMDEDDIEVELEPAPKRSFKTILPETYKERIFTLQERGALLQRVHFSQFMLGYDVYLGTRGEVGTVVREPAAAFQVRRKTVSLMAHADGVVMNGEVVPRGEARLIDGDAIIEVGTQRLDFRELRHIDAEGWPYVGEIRRAPSSQYLLWGREDVIGRSRECRVVLPDEPNNENIVWKPKIGDGAFIHTRNGDIPKARVYTDSIMVASEHAAFDLRGEAPQLVSKARNCYSYIRRGGRILVLDPTTVEGGLVRSALEPGDEVLVGNCLFQASFTPVDQQAVEPAPAPQATMLDDLVDAVSVPDLDELDAPPPPSFAAASPALDDEEPEPPRQAAVGRAWGDLPDLEDEAPLPPPRVTTAEVAAKPAPPAERAPEKPAPKAKVAAAPEPAAAPVAAPVVAPAAPSVAPAAPSVTPTAPPAGGVAAVDDGDARFELSRPGRLVLEGWTFNGTASCGNHHGADLVIPESRVEPGQVFEARTYFDVFVRGRKSRLDVHDTDEVRVSGGLTQHVEPLDGHVVEVIRRDDVGDEDFTVNLSLADDPSLPDPRARLLRVVAGSSLVDALFTLGFPMRTPRTVSLGGGRLTVTGALADGALTLSGYLDSYRTPEGYLPFFVQSAGGRFQTAPEDGQPIRLVAGDRLIVDRAVYRVVVT